MLRNVNEPLVDKLEALKDWLRQQPTDQPLFLFFHTYEVHAPYKGQGRHAGRFAPVPALAAERPDALHHLQKLLDARRRKDDTRHAEDAALKIDFDEAGGNRVREQLRQLGYIDD
jgi:hypothetical protein